MSEHGSAGPRRGRLQAIVPGTRTYARPASELIAMLEATDPQGTAAAGLSSAAMRAADLVRGMRREARLSQEDLAARIGVSQARISELEAGRGQQGPTWDVMDRIATACGRELGVVGARTTDTSGTRGTEVPLETSGLIEEAVVKKQARVVEETYLRKEAGQRVETVRDTVRKSEVEVDDQTAARATTGTSAKTREEAQRLVAGGGITGTSDLGRRS